MSGKRHASDRHKVKCHECDTVMDNDYKNRRIQNCHALLQKAGQKILFSQVVSQNQIKIMKFFDSALNTVPVSSNTNPTSDNTSEDSFLILTECFSNPLISEPAHIYHPEMSVNRISLELEENKSSDSSDKDNSIIEVYYSQEGVDSVPKEFSSQIPESTTLQPHLQNFPNKLIYGRNRSFQTKWYKEFSWISYIQNEDTAICFPCKKFGSKTQKPFVFKNWSKPKRLKKHAKSIAHQNHMIAWIRYKSNNLRESSILSQVRKQREDEVKLNRMYLSKVIETLAFLAKQNIAIRGHKGDLKTICETSNSNRGNFLELLHLRSKDLPWFKEKFEELNNRHRMWLSPDIQNEILDLIASKVTKIITDEVIESRMYSIIADETLDISRDEQCSLYLRYVLKGMIKDKFIGFYLAKSTTAKALFELVTEALKDLNLDPSYIVGQGYDGASNMKGEKRGLQTLIKSVAPKSIYVHCFGHLLNLAVQKSVSKVIPVRNSLGSLQKIYTFIEASGKRHLIFQDTQKARGEKVILLQSQSETRWAMRHASASAIKKRLGSTIISLMKILAIDSSTSATSAGLLVNICDFNFIFVLILIEKLLSISSSLSTYLQSENMDVFLARKSEDSFSKILNETETMATEVRNIIKDEK